MARRQTPRQALSNLTVKVLTDPIFLLAVLNVSVKIVLWIGSAVTGEPTDPVYEDLMTAFDRITLAIVGSKMIYRLVVA